MKRYSIFILLLASTLFSCKKQEEEVFNAADLNLSFGLVEKNKLYPHSAIIVAFNKPMEQEVTLEGEGTYKPVFKEISLKSKETEQQIEGQLHWNTSKDTLWFVPSTALGTGEINVKTRVEWEVKDGQSFKPYTSPETGEAQGRTLSFTSNVASYPEQLLNSLSALSPYGDRTQLYQEFPFSISPFTYFELDYSTISSKYLMPVTGEVYATDGENKVKVLSESVSKNDNIFTYLQMTHLFPSQPLVADGMMELSGNIYFKRNIAGAWDTVKVEGQPLIAESFSFPMAVNTPDEVAIAFKQQPVSGDQVSVYFTPLVSFTSATETPVAGNKLLRMHLNEAVLTDEQNSPLSSNNVQSEDGMNWTLYPDAAMQANTNYTLTVTANWQYLENGEWTDSGEAFTYQQATTFTTSAESDSELISYTQIDHSYPAFRQYNYLKNEYTSGHIKLKHLEDEVLSRILASHDLQARFTDTQGNTQEAAATFAEDSTTFNFQIPLTLANNEIYKLELVGLSSSLQVNALFAKYHFKTSLYNTFPEKMGAQNFDFLITDLIRRGVYIIGQTILPSNEGEGLGYHEANTFIQPEALLEGNNYYEQDVYPYVYRALEEGYSITNRTGELYGIPPVKAIELHNISNLLSPEEIQTGVVQANTSMTQIRYNLPDYYYRDFRDISQQVAYKFGTGEDLETWESEILSMFFPLITNRQGEENRYVLHYHIPGTQVISSSVELSLMTP